MLSRLLDNLGPYHGMFGDGSGFIGSTLLPIKSIQYCTVTFGAGDTTKDHTGLTAVVVANSVVLHLGVAENANGNATWSKVEILSTTSVRFTKNTAGGGGVHKAVLIEFAAGVLKTSQDYSVTIAAAAVSNTATLGTAVVVAKTLLVPRGQTYDDVSQTLAQSFTDTTLTDTTTVTVARAGNVGAVTVVGTAIEFN